MLRKYTVPEKLILRNCRTYDEEDITLFNYLSISDANIIFCHLVQTFGWLRECHLIVCLEILTLGPVNYRRFCDPDGNYF